MAEITISYEPSKVSAVISGSDDLSPSAWNRVIQACMQADPELESRERIITMAWANALPVLIEIATLRGALGFHMQAVGEAQQRLSTFRDERRMVRSAREGNGHTYNEDRVVGILISKGFTKRVLKDFQLRDIRALLALKHGANFSVPGAGKTTVAFAVHVFLADAQTRLLVVGPKNAFAAWDDVVIDCMEAGAPDRGAEVFTRLNGSEAEISRLLNSPRRRFIISYERCVRVEPIIKTFLRRRSTHLILDESHRIKAGELSQRGRSLLSVAPLPVRKDILSGTPAPNSISDLSPQFEFLWPGTLIGSRIVEHSSPKEILKHLYVRTTKHELGLPPVDRDFVHVEMSDSQLALYSLLRSETVQQLAGIKNKSLIDIVRARRCVMRLLQASANPPAAALALLSEARIQNDDVVELLRNVVEEGNSPKLLHTSELVRNLVAEGRKVVVWTIFRDTIERLDQLLIDLGPAILHGGVTCSAIFGQWNSLIRGGV